MFIDRSVLDFLLREDGVDETLNQQLAEDRQVPAVVWLSRSTQGAAHTRGRIIEESLQYHGIENRDGILRLSVPEDRFGDALFSYLQGLTKAANVTHITKEVAKTTFFEDFNQLIASKVPSHLYELQWTDSAFDPNGLYEVDCRINTKRRPWLVFAVNSNYKCQNVVITCLTLEKHIPGIATVATFEDQTEIDRRPLARLLDVVGKQFSSLDDKDRINQYIENEILSAA